MSAAPAYNYQSAGYAPDYARRASARPAVRPERRTHVTVTPGKGSQTQQRSASQIAVFVAKVAACVLVVMALAAMGRIALGSAAISVSLDTQKIENSIYDAQSAAESMQVQQSVLSNPTRVKTAAKSMKMVSPDLSEVAVLDLAADAMVLNEAGNLSLAESMRTATSAPELG